MSYEQPLTEWYGAELGTFTLSAGATLTVKGPKGCTGFVREMIADVTTSIVGTTSVPEIAVGLSSADATYGRYRLGTTASTGYGTGVFRASQEAITGNPPRTLADYAGHVLLERARIPADTAFTIAVVAAVGSPAGAARLKVRIDWHGSPIM